jgi:hypothetical protein
VSNAPDPQSRRAGRSFIGTAGLFLVLYALSRLGTLDVLPIFLDEAVHIQWAERLFVEGRILRPVAAGRLLAVVSYGLALLFEDRVWAARVVAAGVGALTLLLTLRLADRLFGRIAVLAAGVLYLLSPLALTYDRLALSDGFLAVAVTSLLVVTLDIAGADGRRAIVLAALAVALAVLAKVSALLYVGALPLGAALLAPRARAGLARGAGALLAGLAIASPMLFVFAVRGGEIATQHLIDLNEADLQMRQTLATMLDWARSYFSFVALAGAAASAALLRDRVASWLLCAAFLPVFLFAVLGQPWSARYVLPSLPPFLVLIAGGICRLAERWPSFRPALAIGLATALSAPHFGFVRQLLVDPADAPFPDDDRRQLVTGWPSGYGVRELAARLTREAAGEAITVYLDTGGTRTVATDLGVLLHAAPRIRIVEADLASPGVRSRMSSESGRLMAVVGPRADAFGLGAAFENAVVERLEVFVKPGGEWAATLFEIRFGRPDS